MNTSLLQLFANRQVQLICGVFGCMFTLLALAYYLFLRTDYAVLYNDLRTADASAVVAELDAQGIDYSLRDGGSTILVPADQADAVRLAIVRSDAAVKGTSGFELFNKSDMGLTDFAQKINYQRALQGELARTIMTMDGVLDARVHLALPERSIFRGNRSDPKAAVTIAMRDRLAADDARVAGIQRLVAAAVPDLALEDVVVLDDAGRVISSSALTDTQLSPAMEERSAIQRYYRARARAAVEKILPGLKFDVRILLFARSGVEPSIDPSIVHTPPLAQDRNFSLRLTIVTDTALNPEDRQLVDQAVSAAVGTNPANGDSLAFVVGPTTLPAIPSPTRGSADRGKSSLVGPQPSGADHPVPSSDWSLLLAATAVFALLLFLWRGLTPGLSKEERDAFVERIRRQLRPSLEDQDVRT